MVTAPVPDQRTNGQAGFRAKSGQFQAGKRSLVDLDSPDFVTGKADLNTGEDILDRMFFFEVPQFSDMISLRAV